MQIRTAISYRILAILALGISTFLIFQNLGAPAIRQWDEAIYANNALDMYYTGDPIVLRRNGEVTLYNTKPPTVIWFQTICLHIFGVNEFAIRFPSAMAGVLTCIMLLIFSAKTLKDIRIGIVSVLVLCTSYGFVRQHVIKTGDMDAMLVMWTTFYTFLFLHLLLAGKEKQRALIIWTGIGVIGAFLAKGIAGFVPLAGILICAIVERKLKWILTRKETYIIALLGIFITVGYYMLRESLAPGYLSRTLKIDFGRFTTDYMAWHHHPWYYYIRNWYALEFFTPYIFWLPMAVVTGFLIPKYRKAVLLLTIQVVVFIALFSYPKVKLMWYDAPAYPLLSLICAIGFIALWDAVQTRIDKRPVLSHMVFGITLLLIFAIPVKDMYKRNAGLYLPADQLEREGFFIRELKRTRPELKNYKVLMLAEQNAHFTQLDFYLNAYNRHMGYELQHLRDTTEVRAGDTIAVCQEEQMEWLERNFQLELIRENQTGCVLVNVLND